MDLGQNLPTFNTWQDVIDYVRANGSKGLRYYAPCLLAIESATVRQSMGRDVIAIKPIDKSYDPFVADEGHLSRFRRLQ